MQNERNLLNIGGIAAVCFAGVQLVYLLILLIGQNLNLISVGNLNPENILAFYQSASRAISVLMKLFSFAFLVPALMGLLLFLSRYAFGLARIGFLYGAFAYGLIFIITFLEFGIIRDLAFQSKMASFAMQNDIYHIHRIIQYLEIPNQILYFLFLLTWGMAFKKVDEFRARLTSIFMYCTAGFLCLMLVFSFLEYQKTTNVFFLLMLISTIGAYFNAGTTLFKTANE